MVNYNYMRKMKQKLSKNVMKSLNLLNFVLVVLLVLSCNSKNSSGHQTLASDTNVQIIVYGSPDCIHCIHFKHLLDSAKLLYVFKPVTEDTALFREMMDKIHKANIRGYIQYPVVDVNGTILVHPPITELIKYLK